MKKCPRCKLEKLGSEFNKDKSRPDGLQSTRNACRHKWYLANQTDRQAKQSVYRKNNKSIVNRNVAHRRTLKKDQTSLLASISNIEKLYAEAERLTNETGIAHVVDHNIPLTRGGNRKYNAKKGKKFTGELSPKIKSLKRAAPVSASLSPILTITSLFQKKIKHIRIQ